MATIKPTAREFEQVFEQKRPLEKGDLEGRLYMDAKTVRKACMVAYLTAKAVVYSCFNDKHFPYGFSVCVDAMFTLMYI